MNIRNALFSFVLGLCLTLGMLWLCGGLTQVAAAPAAELDVCPSGCTYSSIQDAVNAANPAGGDVITVATGTYVENVTIGISLTLQGAGVGNTIMDGNGAGSVITVTNSAVVTIVGVTIQNGNAADRGGGINNYDHSTVNVNNSAIYNNSSDDWGGGIYNNYYCTTNITNSTIYSNTANHGGGLYNTGTGSVIIVTNSTIYSNTAASAGGGIMSYGPLTVTNSTISGNTASNGGGIFTEMESDGVTVVSNSTVSGNTASGGNAGGIYHYDDGTLNITNSTISGNTATGNGGGIFNVNDDTEDRLNINHSTISNNTADGDGGGIYNDDNSGTANVKNTIIAGNTITNCGGEYADLITSRGYNIEETDTCNLNQTSDITNSAAITLTLGPLQDNGGDTWTHALLEGSPAIDAGYPAFTPPPDFDQRGPGFPRVVNDRLDIGAYEAKKEYYIYLPLVLRN